MYNVRYDIREDRYKLNLLFQNLCVAISKGNAKQISKLREEIIAFENSINANYDQINQSVPFEDWCAWNGAMKQTLIEGKHMVYESHSIP